MFLQVRQGFIYDEDQKAVTKSIRDRIAQVILNRRSIKREISGEEKKEKEKLDSEEQAVKPEGEDSDKEQHSAEPEKEKEDKDEKNSLEEPDPMTCFRAETTWFSALLILKVSVFAEKLLAFSRSICAHEAIKRAKKNGMSILRILKHWLKHPN